MVLLLFSGLIISTDAPLETPNFSAFNGLTPTTFSLSSLISTKILISGIFNLSP